MGGTGNLAQVVTDYIQRSGGVILTGTAVTYVDANQKTVQTSDGDVYGYKKLVWAADQKALYSSVKAKQTKQTDNQRMLTENGTCNDSILTLFTGVDLDPSYFRDRCGAHAFYTPSSVGLSSLTEWNEAAATEDSIYEWIGKYLERTTYEISCPALRDSALAPQGKTGVIISTLMDYNLVTYISNAGGYNKFKEYCTSKIINLLDEYIFKGMKENVEFAMCSTPLTIERETGNTQGAITGWAFTNGMPAENRFKKIKNSIQTPIDGIYQCGQWTFSPSGLPVSILTGKLSADAIHKSLKGDTV